jgi:hypothetical protein
VLALVRAAFARPEAIAPDARETSRTLLLLRRLAEQANQDSLKQQIEETIALGSGSLNSSPRRTHPARPSSRTQPISSWNRLFPFSRGGDCVRRMAQ